MTTSTSVRNSAVSINPTDIEPGNFDAVPSGYVLNHDSTEPVWFGPEFEKSWANWTFDGFTVWASDGEDINPLPLARAKELHRQLTGILTAMDALPNEGTAA